MGPGLQTRPTSLVWYADGLVDHRHEPGICQRQGRFRHAPYRASPPRSSRRRAQELGGAAGPLRVLLFRRRLARADQRVREHHRPGGERHRQRGRLDCRRRRPRAQHALHPVAGARTRRALPAAPDGGADSVARAGADLQGAARAAHREGPVHARVPGLSAASGRRHRHLRRQVRAGGRRSGGAPRAGARIDSPLPQLLRRSARRASAAADAGAAPARARQPEDEQELRQHDRPVGRRGDRHQEGAADVHGSEARPGRHSGHGRGQPGVHVP